MNNVLNTNSYKYLWWYK